MWYSNSTQGTVDTIVDSVIVRFKDRSIKGIKKYNNTMDRDDLSVTEWIDHAIEEQMDNILYLTKLKKELSK
jgi:hypothetical protein|tara:strand:+ start:407 stop:622 length:216 start_codon:yes stop_codon:yes gene_type:complete